MIYKNRMHSGNYLKGIFFTYYNHEFEKIDFHKFNFQYAQNIFMIIFLLMKETVEFKLNWIFMDEYA